jgi:hypothetical protein
VSNGVAAQGLLAVATIDPIDTLNDPVEKNDAWEQAYALDRPFLATTETVTIEDATVKGFALPEDVLRKVLRDNALHRFPGIPGNAH